MEAKTALNDKCHKLEAENQTLIIQVKVLKISLNKSNIKVREGEKSLESVQINNDAKEYTSKTVNSENKEPKRDTIVLRTHFLNLSENKTSHTNEDPMVSMQSVTSKLSKVGCSMTPVPLEYDKCEFTVSSKESLKTHIVIKHNI